MYIPSLQGRERCPLNAFFPLWPVGRVFFVCRRAAGNPPGGRCDYFAWAGNREVRGAKTGSQKSGGAVMLRKA